MIRYGAMGLPLAFAALPLYVLLPQHHAQAFGMPLATLGALLLVVRGIDALWDPLIGRWADAALDGGGTRALGWMAVCAGALLLGFVAVFFPPQAATTRPSDLLAWSAAALVLTCLAYSGASVLHQAWAARLGGGDAMQSRLSGSREGAALLGVLLASALPTLAGWPATGLVLALALAIGWVALLQAPQPAPVHTRALTPAALALAPGGQVGAGTWPGGTAAPQPVRASVWSPWRDRAFRGLLGVYMLNGIANAVPATLLLFYVQDRLQATSWTAGLLAAYFACGALSLPWWVRGVARWGLARCWALGMGLAVLAFGGAALLGPGDAPWFLLVCVASGLTLGADLAVPPALLARVIRTHSAARPHDRPATGSSHEGLYFGWWTSATKANLALAAGLALPLLQALGYQPGARDESATLTLALAYALLPCALKLLALAALARWQRAHPDPTGDPR